MILLDTGALEYFVSNQVDSDGEYSTTFDVRAEFEVKDGRRLPRQVRDLWEVDGFDRGLFLRCYKDMLNAHGGSSFYNMTGFGDVSILAVIKMTQVEEGAKLLPNDITVVTTDGPLAKRVRKEAKIPMSSGLVLSVNVVRPVDYWGAVE